MIIDPDEAPSPDPRAGASRPRTPAGYLEERRRKKAPLPSLSFSPLNIPGESLPLQGRGQRPRPFLRGLLLALPLIFFGWIATLALAALVSDAAPARYVLLPPETLLAELPEARLLGGGSGWLMLASDGPGFTRALYRSGARLVLPAGLNGCGFGDPRA